MTSRRWTARAALIFPLLAVAAASAGCAARPPTADTRPFFPPPAPSTREEPLPVDPAVTVGTLANGLTYYIRPHGEPANRAEIWLAVDAGSLQEDEDQRGLAHFVEHMAFNGTERYAGSEIVDYLELTGMRFGPDVNAYTSFDETVYTLTVPTDGPAVLEQAFDILREWAGAVAFDPEEIDRERGVVTEEWRAGRGADSRLRDRQLPVIFKGSRYAKRLPIGRKEVLEEAPYQAIRRFYRDWYRPDLMAVIVVGDLDPAVTEKRIRERFSSLRGPAEPRERVVWPVPDHDETLVTIATDPEATSTLVRVYTKLPKRPDRTAEDYRRILVESLHHSMLNDRLDELAQEADPPFIFAFSSSGSMVRSKDLILQVAGVEEGMLKRGLEALLVEVERVDRHGFTGSELERAKKEILRDYEQAWRERDKLDSSTLAAEILRHFLQGEPMPGLDRELELVRSILPEVTLEEVNLAASLWITEENRVVAVTAPGGGEGAPATEDELLALFRRTGSAEIGPWVDRVRKQPLLEDIPEPGSIVEESQVPSVGLTRWTLSNGVKVLLKPTEFRHDEILLSGYSPGGSSLVPDEDHSSALFAESIASASGLGAFDATELAKALAGVVAGVSVTISELEEGVSGRASPEDLETMLQLLYLRFTAPRFDEKSFLSLKARLGGLLENRLARPETFFGDRLTEALYQGHHRRRPLSMEILEEVDLRRAERIYRQRFADAGDFTFVLVGSFDPAEIRPPILRYLGGLPSSGRRESWRDPEVRTPEGVVEVRVERGIEPKSRVRMVFTGEAPWSRRSAHDIASLAGLLRIRLREVLREEMAGTYGVDVSGSLARRPSEEYIFSIGFGCSPQSVEDLIAAVFREIASIKETGAREVDIAKIKETQRRQREMSLRQNVFWLEILENYERYGDDPEGILEFDELVEGITAVRLRDAARRYLGTDRYVLGVLRPEAVTTDAGP